MIVKSKIVLLLLFIIGSGLQSAPLMHPYNLDFEEGEVGSVPRGWLIPEYASSKSYNAALVSEKVKSGRHCLELSRYAEFKDSIYGSVMQSIDAKPYQGKIIKFGAWIRAEIDGPTGSAHLWLIEYLPGENIRFYDLMENNPIVINTWKYYEITADIAEDADYINFGLMLKGNGKAWIDSASFEIIGDESIAGFEPSRKLSEREILNISAFAQLYGLAKYFSPTTESLSLDWEKFANYGISKIINSQNDLELRHILSEIFTPVNPSIKIYDPKLPPENYYYTTRPEKALKDAAITWLHIGSPTIPPNKLSSSKPVNVYQSLRKTEGAVVQLIDASAYAGKLIKFTIISKCELIQPNGRAEIRLLPETDDKNINPINLVKIAEISGNKWKDYSIETILPDDVKGLRIGLVLSGDGKVYFDDAKLTLLESGKVIPIELRNPGFEEDNPGRLTRGWRFIPASETEGYSAEITTNDKKAGLKSLLISSDAASVIRLPLPGEIITADISKTIKTAFPVCLYTDNDGTLPHSEKFDDLLKNISKVNIRDTRDFYSRLAMLVEVWNIMKHFNSYSRNQRTWDSLLIPLISKTALDRNARDFLQTLEILTKQLNESQARVWKSGDKLYYGLPFLMQRTGNKLIISKVHESCNDAVIGDVITKIGNLSTIDYLDSLSKSISSANDARMYLRAVAALRAGMENSVVRMTLLKSDGTESTHDFRRNVFLADLNEDRLPEASLIRDGIYYVDLTRITDKDFFELIDTLSKAKGIILDLRGNTSVSEHILSFFIKEPIKFDGWSIPVFIRPGEKIEISKKLNIDIKARGNFANSNLVILQDERTIGFSEEIVSIVKDFNIGRTIGRPTAGTAGEISGFSIGNDYGFSWTTINGLDAKGNYIYGKGITPTNSIIDSDAPDETLQIAFELIN